MKHTGKHFIRVASHANIVYGTNKQWYQQPIAIMTWWTFRITVFV